LTLLAFLFLGLALLLWFLARRTRQATSLPAGRVVYTDTRGWGRLEKPLYASRLHLTGKPDYLVQAEGRYVPVEVKSGRAPDAGAYPAHLYQLAAYCALVAEVYQSRPPHGLIRYADKTLAVDFTPELESELEATLDDLRADAEAQAVARSHASPARCRACGFREVCGESLG
jgi:CRISPR-associated exonuclease Cas4